MFFLRVFALSVSYSALRDLTTDAYMRDVAVTRLHLSRRTLLSDRPSAIARWTAERTGETGRVGSRYRELKPGLSRGDNSQSLLHEISRSCLSTVRTCAHWCTGTRSVAQRRAEPSAVRLRETRAARPQFVIGEISSTDQRDEIRSVVEAAFSLLG